MPASLPSRPRTPDDLAKRFEDRRKSGAVVPPALVPVIVEGLRALAREKRKAPP